MTSLLTNEKFKKKYIAVGVVRILVMSRFIRVGLLGEMKAISKQTVSWHLVSICSPMMAVGLPSHQPLMKFCQLSQALDTNCDPEIDSANNKYDLW